MSSSATVPAPDLLSQSLCPNMDTSSTDVTSFPDANDLTSLRDALTSRTLKDKDTEKLLRDKYTSASQFLRDKETSTSRSRQHTDTAPPRTVHDDTVTSRQGTDISSYASVHANNSIASLLLQQKDYVTPQPRTKNISTSRKVKSNAYSSKKEGNHVVTSEIQHDAVTPTVQSSVTSEMAKFAVIQQYANTTLLPTTPTTQPETLATPTTSMTLKKDKSTSALNSQMYEQFQSWAVRNYGDSGKTKTVTRKKYQRIVAILNGDEKASTDNSKFRFWVKAKGFRLGQTPGEVGTDLAVYVPSRRSADVAEAERTYKKVAVVEDFFSIIYGVHVEMDGRGGKHAGQKRTYRAIAETYSFLPREAVTKFLMSCGDCQKRMHVGETNNNTHTNNKNNSKKQQKAQNLAVNGLSDVVSVGLSDMAVGLSDVERIGIIDLSMPLTHTYLNHFGALPFSAHQDDGHVLRHDDDDQASVSSADSEMSMELSATSTSDASPSHGALHDTTFLPVPDSLHQGTSPTNTTPTTDMESRDITDDKHSVSKLLANNNNVGEKLHPARSGSASPVISGGQVKSPGERKRRASDELSLSSSTKACDLLDDCSRDDDDNDDDDDDDKLSPGQNCDPEKLKAFNMFVRLFVDENLDRNVPISKQPKDKIQAILEACDRQFPEFHNRSRKRIRTYLKSCRRMRRSKDHNGIESLRPTPPHLASAAAEGILAQACENESNNAKRMRMGLDPLPCTNLTPIAPPRTSPSITPVTTQATVTSHTSLSASRATTTHAQTTPLHGSQFAAASAEYLRSQQTAPTSFRPPSEFHQPFFANGNALFRPGFGGSYQTPAHHHPSLLTHASLQHTQIQNGPTDLSLKKSSHKNQLSSTEVVTIKQLIAGYRESAAFLYRSADELEQLLLQQN